MNKYNFGDIVGINNTYSQYIAWQTFFGTKKLEDVLGVVLQQIGHSTEVWWRDKPAVVNLSLENNKSGHVATVWTNGLKLIMAHTHE